MELPRIRLSIQAAVDAAHLPESVVFSATKIAVRLYWKNGFSNVGEYYTIQECFAVISAYLRQHGDTPQVISECQQIYDELEPNTDCSMKMMAVHYIGK